VQDCPVYLANLNAPTQYVISGAEPALAQVMKQALQRGASRAQRLAVTVPSHCPLFAEAALALQNEMDVIPARRPTVLYLSANLARVVWDPLKIQHDLASNMASQVHWSDTLQLAWERGARLAIEMPGGAVLSNLASGQWSEGLALSCDDSRLDTLVALAKREMLV